MEANLEYMFKKFGFYFPDAEYLTDPEGLLKYLVSLWSCVAGSGVYAFACCCVLFCAWWCCLPAGSMPCVACCMTVLA